MTSANCNAPVPQIISVKLCRGCAVHNHFTAGGHQSLSLSSAFPWKRSARTGFFGAVTADVALH